VKFGPLSVTVWPAGPEHVVARVRPVQNNYYATDVRTLMIEAPFQPGTTNRYFKALLRYLPLVKRKCSVGLRRSAQ